MRYSLPSRDLIADCIETMHEAYRADAMITLARAPHWQHPRPAIAVPRLSSTRTVLPVTPSAAAGRAGGL